MVPSVAAKAETKLSLNDFDARIQAIGWAAAKRAGRGNDYVGKVKLFQWRKKLGRSSFPPLLPLL